MNKILKGRRIVLLTIMILTLLGLYLSDPDGGLSTVMLVMNILVVTLALGAAHFARKTIFDSPDADVDKLIQKASETSEGSGLALIAMSIVLASLVFLIGGKVHAAEVLPPNAVTYLPMLKEQQMSYWANHPQPEVLAGLVEQESCISLKSKSCWSPTSQLKNAREEGAGVGQITRAYTATGAIRFDSLAAMRSKYKTELNGWTWDNVYTNPQYQFRAMVLMSRDNFSSIHRVIPDGLKVLPFADAAYNEGIGGVQSDRRMCQLKADCDPSVWFNNVEITCSRSKTPIYGTRSPCDISRDHVHKVMLVRSAKYKQKMQTLS